MVLRWMAQFAVCAVAADYYRMDLVEELFGCGFRLSCGSAYSLVEGGIQRGRTISALEFVAEHEWDINALVGGGDLRPILSLVVSNETAVKWCLDHGADPNGVALSGLSVLHYAAAEGTLSTLQLLLDAGGDITPTSKSSGVLVAAVAAYRRTPDRRQIIEYLINRGVDINALYTKLAEGQNRAQRYSIGHQTALHFAVKHGDRELVEYLLNHGTDTKTKVWGPASGYRWMSVIDMAERNGHGDMRDLLEADASKT